MEDIKRVRVHTRDIDLTNPFEIMRWQEAMLAKERYKAQKENETKKWREISMKYRDKETGKIIEAHPSLNLTSNYIIDCDGAFCVIPQETFLKIYEPVEDIKESTTTLDVPNKKDLVVKIHLNMDEYTKLLDEGKKKAQELQDIIDKLKNAKVEVKDETGEGVLMVISGKYLLDNKEAQTKDSSNRDIDLTVNCNCETNIEKAGEYVVNNIKDAIEKICKS